MISWIVTPVSTIYSNYRSHCSKPKINGKNPRKDPVYVVNLGHFITYYKQFWLCLRQCWVPSCFHRTHDLPRRSLWALHCQLFQRLELKWGYWATLFKTFFSKSTTMCFFRPQRGVFLAFSSHYVMYCFNFFRLSFCQPYLELWYSHLHQ